MRFVSPIPLSISLELIEHHDDDRMEHMIGVFVAGSSVEARIISDFYDWPRIGEKSSGGLDLPDRLQNLLIFKAFEMLASELDGTDRVRMIIPDVTKWFETQFLPSEADLLKEEFRRHMAFIAEIERNLHDHSR